MNADVQVIYNEVLQDAAVIAKAGAQHGAGDVVRSGELAGASGDLATLTDRLRDDKAFRKGSKRVLFTRQRFQEEAAALIL